MKKKSTVLLQRLPIALLAMAGVGILLFPNISDWFASLAHQNQYGSYSRGVSEMSDEERQQIIESARAYNQRLPNSPLRDPYLLTDDGNTLDSRSNYDDYLSQLNFGKDEPMGWVDIPSIHSTLPILHGTDDKTLEWSAGHLYGSALPVGGESSHAVVTAHSGRANAKLFNDLERVKKGDVFSVEAVGERFYYRVDRIDVVETMYFGDAIRQVPGKDYVTLLTCTPTGVNTYRLLVRGERIAAPAEEKADQRLAAEQAAPEAPWWIAAVAGAPALTWSALAYADRKQAKTAVEPTLLSPVPAQYARSARSFS